LLETLGKQETIVPLLMDRVYADIKTRFTAWELCFHAVVPPKTNTADKWGYDKELHKKRNEIERFFRRIKAFCSFRIYHSSFTLYEHALKFLLIHYLAYARWLCIIKNGVIKKR